MKILLIEDDRKVREFIEAALLQAGMTVDATSQTGDIPLLLETYSYDVIILDRLIGKEDLIHQLADLRRRHPQIKILVLSALSQSEDKVKGLTLGADDYLGKPFHVPELIARIRVLARRKNEGENFATDTLLTYEDLKIDLERQKVFRSDQRIDLTRKELQLLVLLAKNPGRVYSKSHLLDQLWDINHNPGSNIVEVTVANLRSKLDKGSRPLIQSQRGIGYWLGEP